MLIYLIFYALPVFDVREVIVSGNQNIQTDEIMGHVPMGTNIFTLNVNNLENSIKSSIPEISQVKIYKGIPGALKIIINENKGELIWQTKGKSYLVSASGVAFREIDPLLEEYKNLPRVVDNKNVEVKISSQVTSSMFVDFVRYTFTSLKDITNLEPNYYSLDETTVDLNLYTKNQIYIKFDTLRPAKSQLDNLKLVLLERKNDIKEYVDLRINGWAYYK